MSTNSKQLIYNWIMQMYDVKCIFHKAIYIQITHHTLEPFRQFLLGAVYGI